MMNDAKFQDCTEKSLGKFCCGTERVLPECDVLCCGTEPL